MTLWNPKGSPLHFFYSVYSVELNFDDNPCKNGWLLPRSPKPISHRYRILKQLHLNAPCLRHLTLSWDETLLLGESRPQWPAIEQLNIRFNSARKDDPAASLSERLITTEAFLRLWYLSLGRRHFKFAPPEVMAKRVLAWLDALTSSLPSLAIFYANRRCAFDRSRPRLSVDACLTLLTAIEFRCRVMFMITVDDKILPHPIKRKTSASNYSSNPSEVEVYPVELDIGKLNKVLAAFTRRLCSIFLVDGPRKAPALKLVRSHMSLTSQCIKKKWVSSDFDTILALIVFLFEHKSYFVPAISKVVQQLRKAVGNHQIASVYHYTIRDYSLIQFGYCPDQTGLPNAEFS